jgi:hypothetical protein
VEFTIRLTKRRILILGAVFYFLMFVIVAGTTGASLTRRCHQRAEADPSRYTYCDDMGYAAGGFLAGLIWPLYLPIRIVYLLSY